MHNFVGFMFWFYLICVILQFIKLHTREYPYKVITDLKTDMIVLWIQSIILAWIIYVKFFEIVL